MLQEVVMLISLGILMGLVTMLSWGVRGILGGFPGALVAGVMVGTATASVLDIPGKAQFILSFALAVGVCGTLPYAKWILMLKSSDLQLRTRGALCYSLICSAWSTVIFVFTLLLTGLSIPWLIVLLSATLSFAIGLLACSIFIDQFVKGSIAWKRLEWYTAPGLFAIFLACLYSIFDSGVPNLTYSIPEKVAHFILPFVPLLPVISTLNRFRKEVHSRLDPSMSIPLLIGLILCTAVLDSQFYLSPFVVLFWYTFLADFKGGLFNEPRIIRFNHLVFASVAVILMSIII